jgi:CTP:molybdopterin cytidylyltransferase MocA
MRLGQSKPLARVHGRSLAVRTATTLRSVKHTEILFIGPPRPLRLVHELRGLGVRIIANRHRHLGLSTSIQIALRRAWASAAILFVPVDLPNLSASDLQRLIRRWQSAPRCVVARRIGELGGIPLILPRRLYCVAARVTGDAGLRDLAAGQGNHNLRLVEMPSARDDVDTTAALALARRRFVTAIRARSRATAGVRRPA